MKRIVVIIAIVVSVFLSLDKINTVIVQNAEVIQPFGEHIESARTDAILLNSLIASAFLTTDPDQVGSIQSRIARVANRLSASINEVDQSYDARILDQEVEDISHGAKPKDKLQSDGVDSEGGLATVRDVLARTIEHHQSMENIVSRVSELASDTLDLRRQENALKNMFSKNFRKLASLNELNPKEYGFLARGLIAMMMGHQKEMWNAE